MGIEIDPVALEELLNSPEGLVGRYIAGLGIQAAAAAKAMAPVMQSRNFSWYPAKGTSYGPPGRTKASVMPHVGYTRTGHLFAGVNAVYGPTLFMEKPAEQLHYARPFMTDALWSVAL